MTLPCSLVRTAVLIHVLVLPALVAQTDAELVERFDQAESVADWTAALEAATTIVERHPKAASWAFRAGRLHAKLGSPEEALRLLGRSAELGYTGVRSFEEHEHLGSLREHADFLAILGRVQENARRRLAGFQEHAAGHQHPVFVPTGLPSGTAPPLIVALHGTGGTGAGMLAVLKTAAQRNGAVLLGLDALRPRGNGYSWTYRDEAEWLILDAIETAVDTHGVDSKRVVLVGFSQGANIALTLAQTHPDRMRAILPICGHYEPDLVDDGSTPARVFLLTGENDAWKDTYRRAQRDFQRAGAKTRLRTVPGLGHEVPTGRSGEAELTKALRWCLAGS